MSEATINIGINLIKVGVFVYDIVTYPLYAIVQQPWRAKGLMDKDRAVEIPVSEGLCYGNNEAPQGFQLEIRNANIKTVEQAISYACKKHGNKKALGTRQILEEFEETQKNGKVFKKFELGDYTWLTYTEVDDMAHNFGKGLRVIGHQPRENIVIFAETRQEWLMSAMGCFKQNIPVCTLYATLGDEAVIHGINETEVRHIITSHELLPKFKTLLRKCPLVTHITYFRDQLKPTDVSGYKDGIVFNSFEEVIDKGKKSDYSGIKDVPPTEDDTAIIMYTSGSTGNPKGVIMSHFNLVNAIIGYAVGLNIQKDDVYLAYLPLAHVLELMAESMMLMFGVPMGYSTPLTMTDRSSKIKRGCSGDCTVLKPTMMAAVPLILDRIYKGILDKVAAQGPWLQTLFDFALQYKLNWLRRGFETPICNWFVFRKIRALLGGKLRLVASGGAPLSPDTHDFVRATLGVPVLQGYGLTETCGCATLMDDTDMSTGRVGAPLSVCKIKLVNWEEGNYRITDKPRPRGEIIIGGNNIAVGYYKNPEKTKVDFLDEDGCRWFRTGDIGEFDRDGSIRIIDRKKDLVKLQIGEYVSLGKVESELKVCPLVENICVYAESSKNNVVAIVSPVQKNLEELAMALGREDLRREKLCMDDDVNKAILKELLATGKKAKLEKFEMPGALYLTSEQWTPDTGLVTAAFKLKRKSIQTRYQDAINRMYAS
ncbi:long-chain-fatty-acid--CoA ligase 4-like isoform X1 [Penaeus japonicus]|uniref:long-chain-fatty-acid--CoA ligase 4-like isoform X1 n=1 Tax=Penaeus japonicus TaxID=27405 RepID=UPI001C7132FE|nr:long-chain-fatty-acid--CoA ligase 4-like isoform X1 [Penaeus japonicus]XP_042869238.1 long-chain-fatty-acid--CoA ligase 4-like isoform X1 [Penaeus japonicus]XP_042869239.1 long-chain-fatty-acid--CoA ligase 4-like isoform X1 [Penaeus japonicus]XP_042869241.1 long-chain-fatty-acid--CoA ligase 4-like isoform X1 [Penaeus japonicus]XP_042869242.1 long-chain-fatty-acid--CoA ligase 4-like isoform X1 [Penaeus japonicus]